MMNKGREHKRLYVCFYTVITIHRSTRGKWKRVLTFILLESFGERGGWGELKGRSKQERGERGIEREQEGDFLIFIFTSSDETPFVFSDAERTRKENLKTLSIYCRDTKRTINTNNYTLNTRDTRCRKQTLCHHHISFLFRPHERVAEYNNKSIFSRPTKIMSHYAVISPFLCSILCLSLSCSLIK